MKQKQWNKQQTKEVLGTVKAKANKKQNYKPKQFSFKLKTFKKFCKLSCKFLDQAK